MKKHVFVFLGPPGAGKGSLASLCKRKLGLKWLSTGDMCRSEIQAESKTGKEIDFAIKSGKLVSDGLIMQLIQKALNNLGTHQGVIFDGFPRTKFQAEQLDAILRQEFAIDAVNIVRLAASDETVLARCAKRLICSNTECQTVFSLDIVQLGAAPECDQCQSPLKKRSDDQKIETITKRLQSYYLNEMALVDYYKGRSCPIVDLAADETIENVFDEFRRKLDTYTHDCN